MKVVSLKLTFLPISLIKKASPSWRVALYQLLQTIPLIDWVTGPETALLKVSTGAGGQAGLHWSHSDVGPSSGVVTTRASDGTRTAGDPAQEGGRGAEIPGRALAVTIPASEVPEGSFSGMYSESWNIT